MSLTARQHLKCVPSCRRKLFPSGLHVRFRHKIGDVYSTKPADVLADKGPGRILPQFLQREGRRGLPALPLELHKCILDYVAATNDRATLLACALTCTYWLTICEAKVFRVAYIRSLEDLEQLSSIHRSRRKSYILHNTRIVYVDLECDFSRYRQILSMLPWFWPPVETLHWRPRRSSPQTSLPQNHPLIVDGRHNLSVKSVYREYSRLFQMTSLELCNHVFHSFTDLYRICMSLLSLSQLSLNGVSWTHVPHTVPPFPPGPYLTRVQVRECPDIWPLLWLWACPSQSTRLMSPLLTKSSLYRYGQQLKRIVNMAVTGPRVATIMYVRLAVEKEWDQWFTCTCARVLALLHRMTDESLWRGCSGRCNQ